MTDDEHLKSHQVAQLFGVNPKTVNRWAEAGRLPFIRTLGGHRRFPRAAVMALLRGELPTEGTDG